MGLIVAQVLLGMFFGNFLEWFVHKYFLHGLGKKPKSPLSFHWRGHHRYSVLHDFRDPDYDKTLFAWNGRTKEIVSLLLLVLLFLPVLFVTPWVYAGMFVWTGIYYAVHAYSHRNPAWAKKWLRWHYEHHMAPNQEANFNVTMPLWDHIFGTRVKFIEDERGRLVRE